MMHLYTALFPATIDEAPEIETELIFNALMVTFFVTFLPLYVAVMVTVFPAPADLAVSVFPLKEAYLVFETLHLGVTVAVLPFEYFTLQV